MTRYRLSPDANSSIDLIYEYTVRRWSFAQADEYVADLFEEIGRCATRQRTWRAVPARFGVGGFVRHWRKHVIYWYAEDEGIYVFAILHERMEQDDRVREAFGKRER